MGKTIKNYILAALWILGLMLAGADGPVSPFVNISGVVVIGIVSWLVYDRQCLSNDQNVSLSTRYAEKVCTEKDGAMYLIDRGKVY
ncbi:MAG: hypothetical protein KJ737_06150 [Proteobacteria bacterium]|nr:hypothetical protein [Pseudomonadota bacterium]